jgi:2'-5' RNA ligase
MSHLAGVFAPGLTQFALVAYIPGPLGSFLTRLRSELVPASRLLAHVTVLPPRVLDAPPEVLTRHLDARLRRMRAFELEPGGIEIFPLTSVIFLSLIGGRGFMEAMHEELNQGILEADELFEYHPHITLAQQVPPDQVLSAYDRACARWGQWKRPRHFPVETLTFVRNSGGAGWETVSEHTLSPLSLLKTV